MRDGVILEVGLNEATPRAAARHVPYSPRECADPATGAPREGDAALYGEALDRMRAESDVLAYPTYLLERAGPALSPGTTGKCGPRGAEPR